MDKLITLRHIYIFILSPFSCHVHQGAQSAREPLHRLHSGPGQSFNLKLERLGAAILLRFGKGFIVILRAGFWQNGFFADFCFFFGPPDFFAGFFSPVFYFFFWAAGFFRGFSRRIFFPHFCGKKCPEKSSGKILRILYNKNPPTHFCRLAGAIIRAV